MSRGKLSFHKKHVINDTDIKHQDTDNYEAWLDAVEAVEYYCAECMHRGEDCPHNCPGLKWREQLDALETEDENVVLESLGIEK